MMPTRAGAGLFASLRRLGSTAIELVQVRLELFATELEQEKLRLFDALLRALVGLLLLGIGLMLLIFLVVLVVGEPWRIPAVALLTAIFGGCGAWSLWSARQRLRAPGGLFSATTEELAGDRAALAGRELGP